MCIYTYIYIYILWYDSSWQQSDYRRGQSATMELIIITSHLTEVSCAASTHFRKRTLLLLHQHVDPQM